MFQRLVLDQGFYPDGVYTAPDDEAIRRDILLSKLLGFNGARMHEKVFEERYLYWADRLGYLVWGEFPNWGLDITTPAGLEIFLPQWAEAMRRDFGSPALIGWCPFNETWDFGGVRQDDGVLSEVYRYTKTADPLRPCIDTSGNYHVVTDIFDIHDYEQDPKAFAAHYAGGRTSPSATASATAASRIWSASTAARAGTRPAARAGATAATRAARTSSPRATRRSRAR